MSHEVTITIKTIKDIRTEHKGMGLYDAVRVPMKWCEENCNGEWEKVEHLIYTFEDEADAFAFKIRWT